MKLTYHIILTALLLCTLSSLAGAEEATPAGTPKSPSLSPVPAETVVAPVQKTADAPAAQQGMRLGHVDLSRINSESEAGKALQEKLLAKKGKLQTQIDTKRKQLDKLKASLEAKIQSMTPQQREAKAKEFQKKVEEFQKVAQNSEKEMQDLQQELVKNLYDKIERVCTEYGKANGFALIVIKRDLLYLSSSVDVQDVTDSIIKLIDGKEPKK